MMRPVLNNWRRSKINFINEELALCMDKLEENQPEDIIRLTKAMRHSLLSEGKRIRPLLTLTVAEAIGEKATNVLPGALAVEMVHAYSLIHDDLPALDNDDFRRGQPTCHKIYGEAMAILAGDALLSLAFEQLGELAGKAGWSNRAGGAIRVLAKAIGPLGMVGGQVEDLAFEKRTPTLAESQAMVRRKTGELFGAALGVGAALSGGDRKTIDTFHKAGLLAGEAYQIDDDILNQIGDPDLLGKAVGSDLKRGKSTSPTLMGFKVASARAKDLIAKAIRLTGPYASEKLTWLLDSLIDRTF
ncbi:MAG: polyprenyl synthetase family protein [Deltaproteobacteria bacterium]|nr:polyprenyl synthetase family protein [Deltaproteobacteria bacterium]